MCVHAKLFAAPTLASLVFVTTVAAAGTTSPLSSIAPLPAPGALTVPETRETMPGLTMTTKAGPRGSRWHDLVAEAGRGYCLARGGSGYNWVGALGASAGGPTEDLDLHRLVEKGGAATFERTRVHFDPPSGTITATGRSHVQLTEVARTPAGIVVWAYRDGAAVVVLARHVKAGIESHQLGDQESGFPFVHADGCPFAGVRLFARKPEAGALAQLTGALPSEGEGKDKVVPRFIVDASLSRVARDPEPLLAVRVRMQDAIAR
jgi:hypothetical protein